MTVLGKLKAAGLRVEADFGDATVEAKVRDAQMERVPYSLMLGARGREKTAPSRCGPTARRSRSRWTRGRRWRASPKRDGLHSDGASRSGLAGPALGTTNAPPTRRPGGPGAAWRGGGVACLSVALSLWVAGCGASRSSGSASGGPPGNGGAGLGGSGGLGGTGNARAGAPGLSLIHI